MTSLLTSRANRRLSALAVGALLVLSACENSPLDVACTNSANNLPISRDTVIRAGTAFTPHYREYPCGRAVFSTFATRDAAISGQLALDPGNTLRVRGTATGAGLLLVYDPDRIEILVEYRITIVE